MLPGGKDDGLHDVVVVLQGAGRLHRLALVLQDQNNRFHGYHPVPGNHHRGLLDLEGLPLELQRHRPAAIHKDVEPKSRKDWGLWLG